MCCSSLEGSCLGSARSRSTWNEFLSNISISGCTDARCPMLTFLQTRQVAFNAPQGTSIGEICTEIWWPLVAYQDRNCRRIFCSVQQSIEASGLQQGLHRRFCRKRRFSI